MLVGASSGKRIEPDIRGCLAVKFPFSRKGRLSREYII
jgi:hypothetical protein